MKVLVLLWDGGGNVPPALSLASGLRAAGHDVVIAGHESLRTAIETRRIAFVGYESGYVYNPAERMDDFEAAQTEAQQGLIFGSDYYGESERLLADVQPDVVVSDGMLAYAVKACLDSGIPTVSMWHTLYAHIAGGPFGDFFDAAVSGINRRGVASDYKSYQALLEASKAVLVFTYEAFDAPQGAVAGNVHFVGPLRESHVAKATPGDRPFVLVALSSVFTNQVAVLNNLAAALGSLDVDAMITLGKAIDPEEIDAPDNVEVQQFVPHDDVLPATRLLVTHGGCGTVMAGLQYGTPMLCLPNNGDQPLNGRRAERLGIGRCMDQHAEPEAFAGVIESMLGDEKMQRTARTIAAGTRIHAGMNDAVEIVQAAKRGSP